MNAKLLKNLLKAGSVGVGAGATAMYLGNEGEGETFTSYPKESRGKRLLRGEQVPFSENLMEKMGLSNELTKNQDLMDAQFSEFNDEVSKESNDWIGFNHRDEQYEFLNVPELHQIILDGSLFKQKDTFDELLELGYIRNIQAPDQDMPEGTVVY